MTLGARMSRRDGAVFVGREAELAFIERLFVDDPPMSVVLLHGPGGIGKSGLLREVERRGALAGWTPHLIEGRDLPPVPEALEEACRAPARRSDRCCCSTPMSGSGRWAASCEAGSFQPSPSERSS